MSGPSGNMTNMVEKWYNESLVGPIKMKHVIVGVILFIFIIPNAAQLILMGQRGLEDAQDVIWHDDEGLREGDSEEKDPILLDAFVWVREGKGADLPGLAGSTSDQNIEVFRDDAGGSEPGTHLWTLTTSSGKIQLPGPIYSATYFWVQARQGAPDAADPLMSKAIKMYIPHTGYQPNDDVDFTIYVRDLTATAPTIKVSDGSSNAISDNSVNHFNTTDKQFKVDVYDIDSDTFYGGENDDGLTYVTDWVNGDLWANGVFFVWKGTTTQPFNTHTYMVPYDGTNVHYIWYIADYVIDDSKTTGKDDFFSVMLETNGNNLNADATVVLDLYDFVKAGTNFKLLTLLDSSALANGASLNPTQIDTKVA